MKKINKYVVSAIMPQYYKYSKKMLARYTNDKSINIAIITAVKFVWLLTIEVV